MIEPRYEHHDGITVNTEACERAIRTLIREYDALSPAEPEDRDGALAEAFQAALVAYLSEEISTASPTADLTLDDFVAELEPTGRVLR